MLSPFDRIRYRAQQALQLQLLTVPVALWHRLTTRGLPQPPPEALELMRDRLEALYARDLDNAERGIYPASLLFQFSIGEYLRKLPALLTEPPRATWRRFRGAHDDLPADADLDALPRYYRRTFHWQTDGWLSERSASLYDLEVESLFGGTASVMRRMALPPLVHALATRRTPRILDVGCGTGSFLRQLRTTLPRAELTGLDLSPHYLAHAHRNLGAATRVSLVAENAEEMPFRGRRFDAVSCVFLFHELPPKARRRVAQEMRRVLRPGGTLVLCDSAQPDDSPALRPVLESFPQIYHEPYFKSYLRDDLAALLKEADFEVLEETPAFLSKVVVARRADRTRAN
ncbi:MAG: methyltransferase domain-containing protein [Myxococcota bacterium]|nr:methyltransferase domain-containing protein [Myxococcota bacterium]